MFIAKYLQDKEHRISELPDILWVNSRTIEEDLSRLRGINDPIQVCGKKFYISDTVRQDGRISFQSTAHPIFLAENLTQVLILLKGLREIYAGYVAESNQKAKDAFKMAPYGMKENKCPQSGASDYMIIKKNGINAYKCAACKNIWEKK